MQKRSLISTAAATAAVVVVAACGFNTVRAATLTAVPMQGGMAMPMVSYHAADGQLRMMMPTDVPQLTPLLVSNPADQFDPADPWFDSLDPSRQGLSFSRRYGFVMDTMTDPLPANAAIWLRKLSGAPELGFYRYAGSDPKVWEPIFGTAGTSNALFWSGMMFHPAVTAPPGTNSLTATFEAYLVDTGTGQEIAGSSSGARDFDWTNVSDGRPTLAAGTRFVVAWDAAATGYVLEWAENASAPHWTAITNEPVVLEGQPAVILSPDASARFFRMRKSP
jgi:hypothetical protein